MIHAVRFRNFKALRDVEIALDRFTILVGPNASGKTTVLDGIHVLSRLSSTDPRFVFEGRMDVGLAATRSAQGAMELGLTGTFRRKRGELAITFSAIEDYPFTDAYRLESRWGDRRFAMRRELNPVDGAAETHLHDGGHTPGGELGLGLVLKDAANLRFQLDRLAEPSFSDVETPTVGPDGRGLAAAVAEMAVARPDEFARLQVALRAVIPGLSRVRLVRVKVARRGSDEAVKMGTTPPNPVWGHEIVFDMAGASDIPARAASEGMLRVLGLFATLLGEGRPSLVLIDQIERAISPRSLGELSAQIHEILALDPEIQIVATTDSPLFLDHQSVESVRVHCLLEDGSVRVKPLAQHPDYETLRVGLRPGELWAEVGDAWVADDAEEPAETGPPPLSVALVQAASQARLEVQAASQARLELQAASQARLELPEAVVPDEAPLDTDAQAFPPSMPPLPHGSGRL